MKLELLKDKKVLVLGLGREGESSFRFLRKHFPNQIIGLADKLALKKLLPGARGLIKKDKKTKLHLGKNYLKAIKDYDIVIKTPGISRKLLLPHITNQKITSQTEIFLEKYRKQTIGITGTKGKGTTASLIYKILKDSGLKVKLIGNMGKPALDYYKTSPSSISPRGTGGGVGGPARRGLAGRKTQDIFIFEISSHQLEALKISPHIAVFLNIYSDHLDYFENFREYFKAKANITKWQKSNDYFIFNNDFPEIKKLAQKSRAETISFEAKKRGEYFLYNTLAAKAVASLFKTSLKGIKKSIKTWKTFEHRLESVGKFKGINFYNDSAATIPEATMAALDFLQNVETLILGGSEKGSDFGPLAKTIIEKRIKTVILFPAIGKKIWQEISSQTCPQRYAQRCRRGKRNLPQHFFVDNMRDAVKICFQHTQKGSVCLLSPACASFTTFENYGDRGNQFKKFVKQLAKK